MIDGTAPRVDRFTRARQWLRDAHRIDWSRRMWHAGVHAVPVPAIALVVGLALGKPFEAMVVVGAAVTAGSGAFHQLTRWRLVPMAVATVGFAISAWVGAVLGRHDLASALVTAALWGAAFGTATSLGQGAWWVGLECMIALCVSGAYPAGAWPATLRAALVLLGGVAQIVVAAVIWRVRGERFLHLETLEPFAWNLRPTRFGFRFPQGNGGLRYTFRVAAVLMSAALTQHLLWRWRSGYWVPMTAGIVLKTDLATTFTRGVARLGGTLIGVGVLTSGVALLQPSPPVLAVVVVASLSGAFVVQRVNYGLYAAFITAYVVSLLSLGGLPTIDIAGVRAGATLVGGALALGSYIVLPAGSVRDAELPV